MSRKLITFFFGVSSALFTFAQDDDGTKQKVFLTVSGSADLYYKYDFAKTRDNSLSSFTQSHNNFSLGMASVKLEHKGEKIGMVADLGFGQRIKDFSYTDKGITQAIKQLYINYYPIPQLKLTAGTWATHVGYEVLEPQLNRNYSMSYMFTNGPFSHTGVKAEYTAGKQSFMAGMANPTDYRIVPQGLINKKSFIAQYSFIPSDIFKLYLNYADGRSPMDSSKSNQIDLVIIGKISESLSVSYNGTYTSVRLWDGNADKYQPAKPWWGCAFYFNYDPQPWFGITLRSELFSDHNHLKSLNAAAEGDNIWANTLSANFKKGGFTFIPEIRHDHVNKKGLFHDADGKAVAKDINILFAAMYSF